MNEQKYESELEKKTKKVNRKKRNCKREKVIYEPTRKIE